MCVCVCLCVDTGIIWNELIRGYANVVHTSSYSLHTLTLSLCYTIWRPWSDGLKVDIAPLKKNKLLTSSLYCIHMPCQISGVYRASCTLSCHLLGYGQAHTQLYQQNPVSVHKERCLFLYISAVVTELYGMFEFCLFIDLVVTGWSLLLQVHVTVMTFAGHSSANSTKITSSFFKIWDFGWFSVFYPINNTFWVKNGFYYV